MPELIESHSPSLDRCRVPSQEWSAAPGMRTVAHVRPPRGVFAELNEARQRTEAPSWGLLGEEERNSNVRKLSLIPDAPGLAITPVEAQWPAHPSGSPVSGLEECAIDNYKNIEPSA
jgi:hypothetical protein